VGEGVLEGVFEIREDARLVEELGRLEAGESSQRWTGSSSSRARRTTWFACRNCSRVLRNEGHVSSRWVVRRLKPPRSGVRRGSQSPTITLPLRNCFDISRLSVAS